MNFTFTWILDKFGFVPKIKVETAPAKEKPKRKQTVKKATTQTTRKRRLG
tara:strand:- start:45 stop:194 length:150 start_codon:yes stop_codon:yes gene_type:complete